MRKLFIATFLSLTASAWAQAPGNVEVRDAWVRATVAQQRATGAFMQLTAKADSRVVQATSPVAGVVEIHEMAMERDVMRMRAIPSLALPAGKTVDIKPGSYHVMLMDLKSPVKEGDVVPISLVVVGKDGVRQTIEVKATARALNMPTAAKSDGHGAGHKR